MTLILFILYLIIYHVSYVESQLLVGPGRRCVPTALVKGPCHYCICSGEGVYECRERICEAAMLENTTELYRKECQANLTYVDDNRVCTCSVTGHWQSLNCRNRFRFFEFNKNPILRNISRKVNCTPDALYVVDCNLCTCDPKGHINPSFCTNHACNKGHKADHCNLGDVLRTEDEFCICSNISYYVDRLCVQVTEKGIQEITDAELRRITSIDLRKKISYSNLDICEPHKEYFFDCNRCVCSVNRELVCTSNICDSDHKASMRSGIIHRESEFESLPEVKSENEKCKPGQKYKYRCNTCFCTQKRKLTCTTMYCLEELLPNDKNLKDSLLLMLK